MKKGDKLTGRRGTYTVLEDFVVTGGMSKVSFVKLDADGKEYFIKEFLAPKLSAAGGPATREKSRKKCEAFEKHHHRINSKISKKNAIGGNLISAFDFFRAGTTYYKVCEKIDISSISIKEVSKLPVSQRRLILRTIVSSLKILHDLDIVHGDLKQDNILIKKFKDRYIAKLIDFDNSYFSSLAPEKSEELVGTQEYYSPELAGYIIADGKVKPEHLTTKSDIFALGILFSEYWCGEKPLFKKDFQYVWQVVYSGDNVTFSKRIPPVILELIKQMLSADPSARPDLSAVIQYFRDHEDEKDFEVSDLPPEKKPEIKEDEVPKRDTPDGGGILRGKLMKKLEAGSPAPEPFLKGKMFNKKS
ncbi:serine/threonine protein kinase [Mucilaginibacter oryzae]|uniref:Serine/threonine protein kinase n=1 Tax=Mucilaginibacter oryzae TaxID=468058 RepID=A0A316GU27_9SPHI|nr:protein kinase [Mucilaginibacter oryzae]PWK65777.1 serine/threonine protein kinase [Mucilaginibacter oryzae]